MSSLDGNEAAEVAPPVAERDMTNAPRFDSAVSDLTLMGASSFESRGSRVDEAVEVEAEIPKSSASSVQNSEASSAQDEEIKQAMAMALAIQNNPHLKPEEIHELLGQRPPPTVAAPPLQATTNASSNKQKAHRFTQMFNAGPNVAVGMDDTASSQHSKTSKYRANLTQMADRARGKLNGMIAPSKSEDEGDRPDETSESQSGIQTNGTTTNSTTVSALLAFSKPEKPKPPLKMTRTLGEAWKRRGGLAKYSSSSPWERRLFSIADDKFLVYSALDKKTNESRGALNLAESTVYASFGHSGAPSPFCLSISAAAAGETKWKISFDRHADQLEWLHIMTAITVRSSVDQYNTQLLAAADPGTEVVETYFHPPDSPSGMAAPPISSKSKQLWEVAVDESVLLTKSPAIKVPSEDDHAKEKELAIETAGKVWMLTDPKRILILWNLGAILARAVTLASFWYILVFGNAAIVYLSSSQVPWQDLLPFVRAATPEPEEEEAVVNEISTGPAAPSYIPAAGCSSVQLSEPTDPPVNAQGEHFAGWRSVPGSGLKVRSAGYSTSKQKVDSPGQLYDCVAVDIFESPQRYPDMAKRVKLPPATYANDPSPKTWRSPDIFIVSIALPTDPPKMGKSSSDGGGYTVTMYYQMREDTREILKHITGDGDKQDVPNDPRYNAVRLFEEWIRRAPADPKFCSRFKVVPNAHNLTEIGMPSWISKYNGKPFLIKRQGVTGFLYTHPELSCVEFDVSLHPFPYLAKQGICFMKDSYFKKILVTFGFVIEGQSEDELPECVIGSMQLCYPDPIYAIQAKDFFAGTAPKSSAPEEVDGSAAVAEEGEAPKVEDNTD